MLSDEDKARIEAEEEYRASVRARLGTQAVVPDPTVVKSSSANNGCLIAALFVFAFLGIIYPPFFVGAVLVAVFWAAIKFLKRY